MSDEVSTPTESVVSDVPEGGGSEDGLQGQEGQGEEETRPEVRKYKVKVDAEEMEVDEQELLKGYQQSRSAARKFQEAADMRRQLNELLASAKQDPSVLFNLVGLDPKEWITQQVTRELEMEMMTPEERELLAERQRFQQIEEENKSYRQQREEAERSTKLAAAEKEVEADIMTAIESTGIRATPRVIARAAEYVLATEGKMPMKDALLRSKRDLQNDIYELFNSSDDITQMMAMIRPETQKRLRSYFVQQASGKTVPSMNAPVEGRVQQKQGKKRKLSVDEYFDNL